MSPDLVRVVPKEDFHSRYLDEFIDTLITE